GVTSTDITKLKHAEVALRESEQRYRSLVMASSQIVWIANAQGQFVEVNGWEEFTGQPVEDLLVKGSREAIHPNDLEWVRQVWWNAVTTKGTYEVEHRIRKYDGTYEYFAVRGVPIFNDEGEIQSWVGMSINIHARRQAEEGLRLSRERLDLVLEAAQLGLWYCDLPFDQLNWNDKCKEHFGLSPDAEVTIDTFYQQIHPDDREQTRVAIERSLSERTPYDIDYRTVAADGRLRWIRAMGRGFYDQEGNPTRFDGITVDISDRKQAEEALRESESRFRVMADGAPVFIWMSGLDGHCTYFNQLWLDFVGQTLDEALTIGWPEGIHPEDKPFVLETYMTAFNARETFQVEYRHRRNDGEYRWIFDVGVPLINSDGSFSGYIGSGIDVTERRQAEQAQQYLAEASKVLSSSLDYQTTLGSIAHLTVPHLADWCTVHLIQDDGSVLPIVTAHVDPAKVMWGQQINQKYPFDPNAPNGVAPVLRTGQSELYPDIPDHLLVETARDAEHLQILREVGFKSVMIVPLWVRGKTLGAIAFISAESNRCYNQSDLALAEELGRRAALAVENARLYRQAQQARQAAEFAANRTMRLQAVTAAFSEALTLAEVALVVVNQGISALEAQSGFVVLLTDKDTTLEIVESVGLPPEALERWLRFPITAEVPIAELVRTGQPIFFEDAESFVTRYPILTPLPAMIQSSAFACIPLSVEGRTIGGMSFGFSEEREFSEDDRAFMLTLGQQCAQAIARARLYEAEQQARTQAESANRIKDEFLAVLSHELRSPLNPILGWVRLLRSRKFDEKATDRALETIERNAKLQTQLIEDLLDVSRILRGKMVLNEAPVNLVTTIEAALETVRLSAQAKTIQIQTTFNSQVGKVLGDANRLQQVVWNLLSNAIKFTPSGGRVEVRLERWNVGRLNGLEVGKLAGLKVRRLEENQQPVTAYAQIQVIDTGKGIDPNFLPYVFDYFRQENSTTTRIFGGLGLGLAIVRHLVELHGGTVSADSPGLEQGAIFTIRLPLMELETTADEQDVVRRNSPSLQGLSILVVDDDNDTRDLLIFTLEQYDAQVTATNSAEAALKALESVTPDILLSDIGMPETDGYMLIREIRKMSKPDVREIPAIALTAYAGETDRQQILKAGFQQHITKPVEPDVLARAIASLLKGSQNQDR
ncbi:MAG TPA: PAS domain S-box protein, partial [Cyanophyceae cyanobacterium]